MEANVPSEQPARVSGKPFLELIYTAMGKLPVPSYTNRSHLPQAESPAVGLQYVNDK